MDGALVLRLAEASECGPLFSLTLFLPINDGRAGRNRGYRKMYYYLSILDV